MNLAQICFDSHSDMNFSFLDASAIQSAPGNQVVLEGNSLTLNCNSSGNSSLGIEVKVHWSSIKAIFTVL